MEYKDYLSRVEFDDKSNIFHGEVINIRDVITFQGKSVGELRQAFEDSVEDYLAFCANRGEKPDQPFLVCSQYGFPRNNIVKSFLLLKRLGRR